MTLTICRPVPRSVASCAGASASCIASDRPRRERHLLLTHGIYGSGSNWRGIARKVVAARPDWGVVLVDLRQHGRSEPGDAAAHARRVRRRHPCARRRDAGDRGARGSQLRRQGRCSRRARSCRRRCSRRGCSTRARARAPVPTSRSRQQRRARARADGAPAEDVGEARRLRRSGRRRRPRARARAVARDERRAGSGGALTLRLDLAALRAMLDRLLRADLWPIALDPALPGELEVVIARALGHAVDAADRARLAQRAAARSRPHVDAGHWLHIEAPATVVSYSSPSCQRRCAEPRVISRS